MPSGLPLLILEVNFYTKRNGIEEKPDQSSSVLVTGWFAYMSTLLSTLALSTLSLAKNVTSPKQELKWKHLGF